MARAATLPPEFAQPFAVRVGLGAGIPLSRMNASDLVAPFHGARMPRQTASAGDEFERARADLLASCSGYVPVAPAGFRFSHRTAARLYGMPLPRALETATELDVAVGFGVTPPRGAGVSGHSTSSTGRRDVAGFPAVEAELAWLQLARWLTIDELVIAGDFLVRRKEPLSTIERLRLELDGAVGARGCRLAMTALREIRCGTDSPMESKTRLIIVRGGLPEPVIGYQVRHDGYFVGTPDLAYIDERIAIEYEGDGHRTDRRVFAEDIDRRERFEYADWRVLRVTSAHLNAPGALVARVGDLLRKRAVH